MIKTDKSTLIKKAAWLAQGTRFNRVLDVCENQKTISTRKLERLIDELMEGDRLLAIYLKSIMEK